MRVFLSRIRRFERDEQGSMSVEAVLIFPILLWAFAAMFIYWDAFKAQNVNLKATYTIADTVSRWPDPITPSFMKRMQDIHTFLISRNNGNDMRITVVRFVPNPADPTAKPIMELQWSEATGTYQGYTSVESVRDLIPELPEGDEMILVETTMTWTPPINFTLEYVGLSTRDFTNTAFASPRYSPQVCWDGDEDGYCDPAAAPTS